MKPFVGISMSHDHGYQGYARDFVRTTYVDAVRQAGGIPVLLANVDESVALFPQLDGLLLTGGGDFDPKTFGAEDRGTDWSGVSPERDRSELAFLAEANQRNMPVFGICRGLQAMTVGFGGSLIQDIPSARPDSTLGHSQKVAREEVTHEVAIQPGSRVAEIIGETQVAVNSFHHQAIDQVPTGFDVAATAPDGIVEAIEHPGDRFLVGVQWHPEDLVGGHEAARRLFKHFVDACAAYHAGRNH